MYPTIQERPPVGLFLFGGVRIPEMGIGLLKRLKIAQLFLTIS